MALPNKRATALTKLFGDNRRRTRKILSKRLLTNTGLYCKLDCMNADLQNYTRLPRRYENIDGTGEMFVGLTVLGFALAGYLEALLPVNSSTWMRVAVIYASLALAVGLAYGTRRAIKGCITWPRTGYVAYPRHGKSWWVTTIIARIMALAVAVGLAFLIRSHHIYLSWNLSPKEWNPRVIILIVISVAAYPIWISRMGGGHRWKWLVLVLMVLGVIKLAILAPEGFGQWARPPVLFVALLWLVSGAGTLYLYARHTKPVTPK
jgi:hypothetical protein